MLSSKKVISGIFGFIVGAAIVLTGAAFAEGLGEKTEFESCTVKATQVEPAPDAAEPVNIASSVPTIAAPAK